MANIPYILIYCYTFTFTMESKKPPAYSWIIFISCETGNQLQYKMSNHILKTALYRINFKSEVKIQNGNTEAYAIHLYYFFLYNAWIKKQKKKTTLFTVLAYLQHINKSLFRFVKHPLSEMYSRLCPVKSSLHFYYIYSIRIWNENTLAVYTETWDLLYSSMVFQTLGDETP